MIGDPGPPEAAGIAAQEIRGDAGFIEKDEARGVEGRCERRPLEPSGPNVGPVMLGRAYRFF